MLKFDSLLSLAAIWDFNPRQVQLAQAFEYHEPFQRF